VTAPDDLQAEQARLALTLAMACTASLATRRLSPELSKLCAAELSRVADLTDHDEAQIQLAGQMRSLALQLEIG